MLMFCAVNSPLCSDAVNENAIFIVMFPVVSKSEVSFTVSVISVLYGSKSDKISSCWF